MITQNILYFTALLLTCALTGILAAYAWRHKQVPGSSAYARLAASESLFALAEILSVLSPSAASALFWFQVRYLFGALIGICWFLFALEYNGHQAWLSKRLLVGLFIIPLITQGLLWSNALHGLWMQSEASFTQNGPFWIADVSARIPSLGYLTHIFYSLLLTIAGIVLLLLTAWKMRREFIVQSLMLAGAGLTAFFFLANSLFNLLPKLEFNPFTPGLGLSVLLIALAVFRFKFLKRAPAKVFVPHLTNLDEPEKRSLAIFILFFLLLASGISASAYLSYADYEHHFRTQVEQQLSAVVNLKITELQDWRTERLGDAEVLRNNPVFVDLVQAYFENPDDTQTKALLQTWLNSLHSAYRYDRVFLLDLKGFERLASFETSEPVAAHLIKDSAAVLASGKSALIDFHRNTAEDKVHLAVLVPIFASDAANRPLGVLVLRIDPEVTLYPRLQQWPTLSETAETLLVRRDGESVLFLNPVRFKSDAALNLRFPLTNTDILAVKAVLGQTGIVEGRDYRGETVLGSLAPVPDTPWFLVARMDMAEVYAPLRARLQETGLFFGVLMLTAGAGLMLAWRQQRANYYRAQYETGELLRKSQEQFKDLIEQAPDGIFIANASGQYLEVNSSGCALLGYTRDEILSKRISDLVAPEDAAATPLRLDELRQGKTLLTERRLVRKDGSLLPVEISGRMLPDGRFQSIVRDITERNRAGVILRESERKLREAQEMAHLGFWFWDVKTGYVEWSDEVFKIFCLDPKEFTPQIDSILAMSPWPEDHQRDQELINRAIKSHRPGNYEQKFLRPDQSIGYYYSTFQGNYAENGDLVSIVGTILDITERKRAEEALANERNLLHTLIDNLPDNVFVKDVDSRIIMDNIAHRRLLGATALEQVVGKTDFDFFPKELAAAYSADEKRVMQSAEVLIDQEEPVLDKDGNQRWLLTTKVPLRDRQGAIMGIVGINHDITERKLAEEALKKNERAQTELLEKLNEAQKTAMLGSWEWDLLTDQVWWSDETYRIFGVSSQDFVPGFEANGKFIHPDDLDKYSQAFEHSFQTGAPLALDLRLVSGDGVLKHCHAMGEIVYNEAGQALRFIGTIMDITARKQAEEAQRQSEFLFRALFELSPDAVVILDPYDPKIPSRIVDCNAAACLMNGYQRDELIGQPIDIVNADPYTPAGQIAYLEKLREVGHLKLEVLHRHKSGTIFPVEISTTLIKVGERELVIGIDRDITERKRAEVVLRQSEERLRAILDATPFPIAVVDTQDNNIEFWSRSALTLFGQSAPTTAEWYQLAYPDPAYRAEVIERWKPALEKAQQSAQAINTGEYRVACRDGSERICELYAAFLAGKLIVTFNDITERKQAEDALRKSQTQLQAIMDYSPALISIKDLEGNVILANRSFSILDAPPLNELIGKNVFDIFPSEVAEQLWKNDLAALQAKAPIRSEEVVKYKDGTWHTFWSVKFPIYLQSDQPFGICAISNDITERKQAEEALRESEDKFKHVFEYSTVGKSITQFNGGMQVNQALCDLLGYSMPEMQAKKWQEITHSDDIELTEREIETLLSGEKEAVRFVKRFLHKNGAIVWVDLSSSIRRDKQGQPLYLMSSVLDITERKRAEEILQSYSARLEAQVMERTRELRDTQEQLVRQERLAALGQLAGSLGHELRNPLGVISNAVYFLKISQPDANTKVREYLDIIEKETHTSNKIVTDLLDFTRIKSLDRQPVSVAEIIDQTIERNPVPAPVEVQVEIPAALRQIFADPLHVTQILGNLISNAHQAMLAAKPASTEKKLKVSVTEQHDMIKITVADTGPGIPPENLVKLFQPLFTTKTKGIGLGLAVSQKLVEANGGKIEVESTVGKGSAFTVYLPIYEKPA